MKAQNASPAFDLSEAARLQPDLVNGYLRRLGLLEEMWDNGSRYNDLRILKSKKEPKARCCPPALWDQTKSSVFFNPNSRQLRRREG